MNDDIFPELTLAELDKELHLSEEGFTPQEIQEIIEYVVGQEWAELNETSVESDVLEIVSGLNCNELRCEISVHRGKVSLCKLLSVNGRTNELHLDREYSICDRVANALNNNLRQFSCTFGTINLSVVDRSVSFGVCAEGRRLHFRALNECTVD